ESYILKLVIHLHHFSPVHTIARKPMSWHDNIEEPADEKFLNLIHHAALEPTKKYSEPQTESQEIGWNTKPLVSWVLTDSALCRIQRDSDSFGEV
uniref:Family with sequence similarity 183 member A n=1 Tax=Strigops habroptila TaxID=2489341 RepID=A0A672UNM4_STRHB